jgi:predicted nuclease of restriction endonuclease-like (RecB) superfamily
VSVNNAAALLLALYWRIGDAIRVRQEAAGWGAKVIDQLAADLRAEFPEMTGLRRTNVYAMRAFATAWPEDAIVRQPIGRLPWGHVITLLEKLDDPTVRDWYATATDTHGWSRNVLLNQIMSRAHERVGAAPSNFAEHLSTTDSELGAGFAFVGRQVHFEVEGDDFFIDLLFFHVTQLRYVVVELKIGKFKPDYTGQLGFYVALVDSRLRLAQHRPTVGLLLCADRNESTVRYSLGAVHAPMAVATYTYDTLPADERAALPSDTDVMSALDTPVSVGDRHLTLTELLTHREPDSE